MASFCLLEEEFQLCAEYIEKAKTFDENHPDTLYIESVFQASTGEWFSALDTLSAILKDWHQFKFATRLNLQLDTLLCDSARALLNTGASDEARELYTKALEINPNNPDACYGAALCFHGLGAVVEAKTMLEWAIRLRPSYEVARQEFELSEETV
jgi:tetratricopeptide (TPR) repeat protein